MRTDNTMDDILVEYTNAKDSRTCIISLPEFLRLNEQKLSYQDKKVQTALKELYKLNSRKPPLYHSFPKKDKPLTIVCTPIDSINCSAHYVPDMNAVELTKAGKYMSGKRDLLCIFAHELKHAEQSSDEFLKMQSQDGLSGFQLSYLEEAQAYAFESYVHYLSQMNSSDVKTPSIFSPILKDEDLFQVLAKNPNANFKDVEYDLIKLILPKIYQMHLYRDAYTEYYRRTVEDKGVSKLPESFHFKNPQEMLQLIKDVPTQKRSLMAKIIGELKVVWDGCPNDIKAMACGVGAFFIPAMALGAGYFWGKHVVHHRLLRKIKKSFQRRKKTQGLKHTLTQNSIKEKSEIQEQQSQSKKQEKSFSTLSNFHARNKENSNRILLSRGSKIFGER